MILSANFYKTTSIFCELGEASDEGTYSLKIFKGFIVQLVDGVDNVNYDYEYLFNVKTHMSHTGE